MDDRADVAALLNMELSRESRNLFFAALSPTRTSDGVVKWVYSVYVLDLENTEGANVVVVMVESRFVVEECRLLKVESRLSLEGSSIGCVGSASCCGPK